MTRLEIDQLDPFDLGPQHLSEFSQVESQTAKIFEMPKAKASTLITEEEVRGIGSEALDAAIFKEQDEDDSNEKKIISAVDAPYIRLSNLYRDNKQVERAVYKLEKSSFRAPTYREEDGLSVYLSRASSFPIQSKEEVEALFADIRPGIELLNSLEDTTNISPEDETILIAAAIAHRKMMITNLRLVVSKARVHNRLPELMTLDDLVEEGNFGLFHAISKFNPDKGFKFSTYASWWINLAMTRALATQSRMIRVPERVSARADALRQFNDEFIENNKRPPTIDEIVDEGGFERDKLDIYRERGDYHHLSLDEPLEKDGHGVTLGDVVGFNPDNPGIDKAINIMMTIDELKTIFEKAGDQLSMEDKILILMTWGLSLEPFRGIVIKKIITKKRPDGTKQQLPLSVSVDEIIDQKPKTGIYSCQQSSKIFACSRQSINKRTHRIESILKQAAIELADTETL